MPAYVPIIYGILAAVLVVTGLAVYFSDDPVPARYEQRPRPKRKKSSYKTQYCVICLTQYSSIKLLPCGHVCLCRSCSTRYQRPNITCPMCRANIQHVVQDDGKEE